MSAEMTPAPGPEVEHHHRHTGHRWLDVTLAVSAVFISLISLFLAIQHGRVMEKMVEANTWAFVTVEFSNTDLTYRPHTRLVLRNKGVGPAKVQSVEVFYNGVAQAGPHALVNAILTRSESKAVHGFFTSDVAGSVLSAKEELDFLDFNAGSYSEEDYSTITHTMAQLDFRVCYCSVLDECSVVDTGKRNPLAATKSVKACHVPKTSFDEAK